MKGDHALALTAYVVLSLAVVGVSVDRLETNQASSPRSASGAATPDGAAGSEPRVSPSAREPRATPGESAQAGPERAPGGDVATTLESLPTGSALGPVVAGAQPRPPAQGTDATPPEILETSGTVPGETESAVPCPGDDSVLVTPVPSGVLCPSPEPDPFQDSLLEDLEDLDSLRADPPDRGFVSEVGTGSAG